MKFISWNVNGLRACMQKGFADAFSALDADFFCLQETKLQAGQIDFAPEGYTPFWCYAEKKDIPARRFLPSIRPFPFPMGWVWRSWTPKAGSSRWSIRIIIS